ncbi:unnamed protein product [Vicia faba]|uniref:NBS-containing resistance-like protein n=1 Tax=Vicia faba TaxID=3906 RepID=A0AAV0Z4H8_VICFA|nr:unnamed protein product [Vicia faba]
MAKTAVSFVLQELGQFVIKETSQYTVEERNSVAGIERDFNDIKDELESIQAFLMDADTKAADDDDGSNGVNTWVKQVREASFRIEDVIDYYNMFLAERASHSIFRSALQMIPGLIKTMNPHHQIASEIQDIKLSLGRIKERSTRFEFLSENEAGRTKAPRIGDPRMAPYFIEETQVVGFESARDELVRCLVEENNELMLVAVVGMGGLGKTTLAKHVFDSQLVKKNFDCRSFITVSQSYTIRELLTEMIKKFCKDSNEPIPRGLQNMDDETLINQVRQYLESKRYLVLFDDVWKDNFSDGIEHALISNNKGSRIIVTIRKMHVADYFRKSFPVHVHELQRLPPDKAWELFCNKTFRGHCPTKLEEMSREIVQKCGGLPLAIVAIGGLLLTKAKTLITATQDHEYPSTQRHHNAHKQHRESTDSRN